MRYIIAILFFVTSATVAFAEKNEHRLSGGECVDMAQTYYRAAIDRDKGNTLEYVMGGMEQIRDSSHDEPDTYIFDLIKAGVTYVFKTPNVAPEQEMQNFLDYCNKQKGFVDSESDYFKGEQL